MEIKTYDAESIREAVDIAVGDDGHKSAYVLEILDIMASEAAGE
jgi:hypothetical protein